MLLISKLPTMIRQCAPILLFFLFFTKARSQAISFSVTREPLEKVFLLVEKQSGYNFIYTREAMAASRPLTLEVKNESLDNVLQSCFRDQPLSYVIDQKHIVVKMNPGKQAVAIPNRELKGKVMNEAGEPVAGVTIIIKGSGQPTATDVNGDFIFTNAPAIITLLISGAEIETMEIPIGTKSFIPITVKARVSILDETIVIAYGKTTQRYSTGSVEKVAREKIDRQPVSNPLAALSGRVSGLQITQSSGVPGTYVAVRIRGQNSIANGNDPLYILDGVPFPSTSLNGRFDGPASLPSSPLDNINPDEIESIEILKDAAATAIYGSRGANGVILITTRKGKAGKPSVALKFYQGLGSGTRKLKLLKTKEYLEMRREAYANDGITPRTSNAPDLLLWDTTRYTDWQKVLIGEDVHATDLTTSLSGGNELTQFLVSGTYHHESTLYPGDFGVKKYSGAMSLSHRSADNKFNLSMSTSFLKNNTSAPIEDLSRQIMLPPNAPAIYSADGSLNWENSTWSNPFGKLLQVFSNRTSSLQANLSIGYKLPLGMEFKFNGGYSRLALQELSVMPARSNIPFFNTPAQANYGHKNVETMIAEPQLSYHTKFGAGELEALAGGSIQQNRQDALYQFGTGYASEELLPSILAASSVATVGEDAILYRYLGMFGRVNYNYAKKYLFSATLRRDGSSRYGPANRFSNFASIGLGWIFSSEAFLKKNKFLSFGKLLFSAGVTGNDQIGDYKYFDIYHPYSYAYQGQTTFVPTQLFNPGFGWERVSKWEGGIELGFLKDRFLLSTHYYHHVTDNQLVVYPLATMTGFDGILKNIPARVLNDGWEFQASATLVQKRKLTWSTSFNLSLPRNRLLAYPGLNTSSYASYYVVGRPLSIVKAFAYTGLDANTGIYQFTDYDRDGQISSPADQQYIVNVSQRFYGGMEHTLSIGQFTASLFFQFVREPNAPSYAVVFGRPGSRSNQPEMLVNRWQKPGDTGPFQRYTYANADANIAYGNYFASDAAYVDASYIRLRNLYLSYQLPVSRLKSWGLRELSFFMQGQNLLTITHYKGLDPETKNYTPMVRMLTGGVKINL